MPRGQGLKASREVIFSRDPKVKDLKPELDLDFDETLFFGPDPKRMPTKKEMQKLCKHCEGEGRVYAYDRSGDGHGGLNGGEWGYFQCSDCHGTGKCKKANRANWPQKYKVAVCNHCNKVRTIDNRPCKETRKWMYPGDRRHDYCPSTEYKIVICDRATKKENSKETFSIRVCVFCGYPRGEGYKKCAEVGGHPDCTSHGHPKDFEVHL